MKLLIRKDLFTQPMTTYLLSGMWFIIFTNFFTDGLPVRHVMLLVVVAYFISISSNNKSFERESVLVNSLPVTRKQIVTAKYAAGFIWFLLSAAVIVPYIFLFQTFAPFPTRMITIPELLIALGCFYLLLALFYPLQFKAGYILASILTIMIPVIAMMSLPIITNILENPRMPEAHAWLRQIAQTFSANEWAIAFGVLSISILVTWLSILLSIRIYSKKDFDHA